MAGMDGVQSGRRSGSRVTPVGYIPTYSDLKKLFKDTPSKRYDVEACKRQFTVKLDKYAENQRMLKIYSEIPETPAEVFTTLKEQLSRLKRCIQEYSSHLNPLSLQRTKTNTRGVTPPNGSRPRA